MAEKCARWFRVSSDAQDERNQYGKVDGRIADRGYEVARTFVLHDRSAYHGEQEPQLAEALEDIVAGKYTVIVTRHSDRLDRRGPKFALPFLWAVQEAGGRIECIDEPSFGNDDEFDGMFTYMSMVKNRKESKDKSERVLDAFAAIDANGGFRGRLAWGLVTVGDRRRKQLAATDVCAEYAPQIFQRIADGQSLGQVRRWLTDQGVSPAGIKKAREDNRGKSGKWWDNGVAKMIRNPVYYGVACHRNEDGTYGAVQYTWEGVVSPSLWKRANDSLSGRPQRRSGGRRTSEREPLSASTYCYNCAKNGITSPLYRIKRADATGGYNLRCTGTGADRRGCGFVIPLETARRLADSYLGTLSRDVLHVTVVPGNEAELADRRARLDLQRRQIAMAGLSFAEEDVARAELRQAYEALDAAELVPDRRMVTPTGEMYGQRWQRFTVDEKASWLKSGELRIYFGRDLASEDHADASETVTTQTMHGFGDKRFTRERIVTYGLVCEWQDDAPEASEAA